MDRMGRGETHPTWSSSEKLKYAMVLVRVN
jgi:hypothetical protein